jgi:hypothetical protein
MQDAHRRVVLGEAAGAWPHPVNPGCVSSRALFLPAAGRGLAPVCDWAAGGLRRLPLPAGYCRRLTVIAIEKVNKAGNIIEARSLGAVDDEAHTRIVWISSACREEDRLLGFVAVACCAVGQEALLGVCPEGEVKGFKALLTAGLHDRTPATLKRFFEQAWKHALKRLPLEMVKKHLCFPLHHTLSKK